jgi:hypothetical protein
LALLALALGAPESGASGIPANPWIPDFARLQYAGQAGLLSLGAGYAWWDDRVEISANYGYIPYFVSRQSIHTFSERNSLSTGKSLSGNRWAWEPLLAGIVTNFTLGDRFQVYLPKAEGGYYWPDALYFWFFAGTRLDYIAPRPAPLRCLGIQMEIGTIHPYLQAYLKNREIGLEDILSLSISVQANR